MFESSTASPWISNTIPQIFENHYFQSIGCTSRCPWEVQKNSAFAWHAAIISLVGITAAFLADVCCTFFVHGFPSDSHSLSRIDRGKRLTSQNQIHGLFIAFTLNSFDAVEYNLVMGIWLGCVWGIHLLLNCLVSPIFPTRFTCGNAKVRLPMKQIFRTLGKCGNLLESLTSIESTCVLRGRMALRLVPPGF
jgi:hypothetical protein